MKKELREQFDNILEMVLRKIPDHPNNGVYLAGVIDGIWIYSFSQVAKEHHELLNIVRKEVQEDYSKIFNTNYVFNA